MKKRKILAMIVSLAVALSGCGSAGITAESSIISNKADIAEVYTDTALVVIAEKEVENKEDKEEASSSVAGDEALNCGSLDTVSENYNIPKMTSSSDVRYFAPIIVKKDVTITSVTSKDNSEASKVEVKAGETSLTGYKLSKPGEYEVTVGDEKISIVVKEGTLFSEKLFDLKKSEAPKNVVVNAESAELKKISADYVNELSVFMKPFIESGKISMNDANGCLESLRELNRCRKIKGLEPMSLEGFFKSFNISIDSSAPDVERTESTGSNTNTTVTDGSLTTPVRGESVANADVASLAREAFNLINDYRASNGLPRLNWDVAATNVAFVRANEIVSVFEHSSASGSKTNGGENIACGYTTARAVVDAWIASPGHKANILNPDHIAAGLAVVNAGGTLYWSNNFVKSTDIPKPGDTGTNTTTNANGDKITTSQGGGNTNISMGIPVSIGDNWFEGVVKSAGYQELEGYANDKSTEPWTEVPLKFISINPRISLTTGWCIVGLSPTIRAGCYIRVSDGATVNLNNEVLVGDTSKAVIDEFVAAEASGRKILVHASSLTAKGFPDGIDAWKWA